ncbi:MAG: hypothetical protein M3384_19500, partial [Acidobacteriota bacterium]|nr:hypothetical protein [Acidobacteriota bacterium]
MFIKIQASPLLKQIEQSDRKSEPHLEICPNSLPQMFQAAHLRKQRKDSFNQHPVIPFAASTQFQVFRLIRFAPKINICQNNHFVRNRLDQRQKLLVGNIRRFDRPTGHESELIGQKAEFAADNPLPGSKAFTSDSFSTRLMIFTNRMTQFNAVRINHAKQSRLGKKPLGQSSMSLKSAKKSGSFRQIRKQISPVVLNPTVKSTLRAAFQSKQKSQRGEFTNRKFSLNMFRLFPEHIIY